MLRTRFSIKKRLGPAFPAVCAVYQQERARGFYKGLLPTLISVVPTAGISFYAFSLLSATAGFSNSASLCGALAGAIAKTATMPLDVLRKRLQVQCSTAERETFIIASSSYTGLADAIRQIYKKEGIFGFYRGLSASLLKAVPTTALAFWSFVFFSKQ